MEAARRDEVDGGRESDGHRPGRSAKPADDSPAAVREKDAALALDGVVGNGCASVEAI